MTLQEEVMIVINQHSAERESNTPDFILAQFLINCLSAFDNAVKARDKWYGVGSRDHWFGPDDLKKEGG